eukprot:12210-Heterococcus_DN1.PRE.2
MSDSPIVLPPKAAAKACSLMYSVIVEAPVTSDIAFSSGLCSESPSTELSACSASSANAAAFISGDAAVVVTVLLLLLLPGCCCCCAPAAAAAAAA